VVGITFSYRSVPDQLDRYLVATRPYTSGPGQEQVAYKPDQRSGRAWSGNLGDRDGRVDLIGSGKLETHLFQQVETTLLLIW